MATAESLYNELVANFKDAEDSQMFGKRCAKTSGKPFVSFHDNEVAFRVGRDQMEDLLKTYSGSKLFDPSGKNRPFKDWIQLSIEHQEHWIPMAEKAKNFTLDNL